MKTVKEALIEAKELYKTHVYEKWQTGDEKITIAMIAQMLLKESERE